MSYGDTWSPTTARTGCPAGTPDALKEKRYDSPFTKVMSFCPTAASQRFTVPPGTSAQSCPPDTAAVTPGVVHHGSVPVSKVPFLICSVSSAPAGAAGRAVRAEASRAVRASRVALRRFTSGLLGRRCGWRPGLSVGALPDAGTPMLVPDMTFVNGTDGRHSIRLIRGAPDSRK